jgi:hypothetical protein
MLNLQNGPSHTETRPIITLDLKRWARYGGIKMVDSIIVRANVWQTQTRLEGAKSRYKNEILHSNHQEQDVTWLCRPSALVGPTESLFKTKR